MADEVRENLWPRQADYGDEWEKTDEFKACMASRLNGSLNLEERRDL